MVAKRTLYNQRYMQTHPEKLGVIAESKKRYSRKMWWSDDPEIREKVREAHRKRNNAYYHRKKSATAQANVDDVVLPESSSSTNTDVTATML